MADRPECCPWSVALDNPLATAGPGAPGGGITEGGRIAGGAGRLPIPANGVQALLAKCPEDYYSVSSQGMCCPTYGPPPPTQKTSWLTLPGKQWLLQIYHGHSVPDPMLQQPPRKGDPAAPDGRSRRHPDRHPSPYLGHPQRRLGHGLQRNQPRREQAPAVQGRGHRRWRGRRSPRPLAPGTDSMGLSPRPKEEEGYPSRWRRRRRADRREIHRLGCSTSRGRRRRRHGLPQRLQRAIPTARQPNNRESAHGQRQRRQSYGESAASGFLRTCSGGVRTFEAV